ncbi:double zinc ribbon and ankyrin repeat-containing protein 1 [Larimichthys crocea]|uniref:double zinc ribbon and ankyrin repeat-containing protein 1 n=1 Tax=Larimichthys crocea TaxID=215358 RepID=UPI000F5E18B1|nr:double zinc ribbon and ankyrin repeat-containing protein 1 [Larimichthys crocea]
MTAGAVSAPLIIPIIHLQTHRAKNHIDTSTPVSIQSDSPGVLIFYTLYGSRAGEVGSGLSQQAGREDKNRQPSLANGPLVGVCQERGGRNGELLQSDQQRHSEGTSWSAENSAGSSRRPPEPRTDRGQTGPSSGVLKQLSNTETSRISRETDFLRCARCLRSRPSDPFARFCSHCGASLPVLPEQRLPPAEGGQVVSCVFCNTLVPVNTQSCLTCEASIHQQLQPQSSITLQDHVVCVCCGSGNPAHLSTCLTCESRLQVCVVNSAPSVPSADSRMLSCSRCKRMNHGDARYCDWCGSKPGHAASCVICCRCGASGHPYAFHCAACGVFLKAPPTSHSDITRPVGGGATSQTSHDATWQATPSSDPQVRLTTPTAEQTTQTVGLYYPSATELERKEQHRAQQHSKQQATRDRQPLLTAISPGRGYWRKQLDHVCAHLRSTLRTTPPQDLLGEPRLGRMVSAVIQEDRYEVSVTTSFVLAGREEAQVDPTGDATGLTAETNLTPKPPVKDVQLLKELGPGRGQINVIQQLLDQGADPSCYASDGRHALAVAVLNGHHDALPVLVQRGADVDEQSGQMKNSALHEAAALGSDGLQCAQVLLSCKASVRHRNAGGQTAYDVAVTSGCNNMVSLLAARTGLDLLGKMGKPKLNLDMF